MFSFLKKKKQEEAPAPAVQPQRCRPDETQDKDWMAYWLKETEAIARSDPWKPVNEPITAGIPAPPPIAVTAPQEQTISGYMVPLNPKQPKRPSARSKKPPVPDDFIRVDPYTQPPEADVTDVPLCEPEPCEAGIATLPPEEETNG